ncbi:sensor histidine kinase [Catenulispora subtropica]|uniref:histidine kinase n=1 Tax=Catenulispora subtropica TaxID=450798 RepID=A0ABN2RVE0_9ACTN
MSLKGELRSVAVAALGRVALRRWVFLILGGALVTPFYLVVNTLGGLLVPDPGPVALMALQFGSFLASLPLVAGGAAVAARFVRPLEVAAVRALLTAEVPPTEGDGTGGTGTTGTTATTATATTAARGRTAAWAVLHLGVGTLVAGATLAVPPAATVLLFRPVDGGGWAWMSDVPAWAGPPAAAFLLAGLASWAWAGGRVLERAAPRLLGPSAAERLAAAERGRLRLAERNRLARELHDSVGHALSIVTLQAAAAGRVLDHDPAFARRALGAIEEAARGAMDELDHVLGLLREEDARRTPQPDLRDIERLAASARAVGTPVTLTTAGLDGVPAVVSREAYRIAQEGLTNALRHAPGRAVALTLAVDADASQLAVTVENPLPTRRPATRFRTADGGRGADGIAERVALLGGTASAGPTAATWRLHARLPLAPAHRAPLPDSAISQGDT